MTATVRPGVFFELPVGLPRGPHQLSREDVEFAQRQRLLIAFTELLADRGYGKLRIGDMTKRAAVSNNTFYELFETKERCACAAYERFVKVIVRMANDAGLSAKPEPDFIGMVPELVDWVVAAWYDSPQAA